MSWDVETVRPVSVAGAPDGAQGAGMTGYQNDLIGDHPSILALRTLIERVARSPAQNVLIYGPTGTGKGMVARMLHRLSARASKQFVDINCAAIPSSLLESELFGHEKGAFTGAVDRKVGLVEAANHGTIFLDEIREMEPMLQTKLLSLLDTHEFRRVGAVKTTSVDVRFIAATNKVLLSEVVAGNFREDLYYRLQVVAINIPALSERGDDVLKLSDYFISRFNVRYKRAIKGLSAEAAEIFLQYQWPGNVRELENAIERAVILCDGQVIAPDLLALDMHSEPAYQLDDDVPLPKPINRNNHDDVEDPAEDLSLEDYFQRFVLEHQEQMTETELAQKLGISRKCLWERRQRLGIPRKKPASR